MSHRERNTTWKIFLRRHRERVSVMHPSFAAVVAIPVFAVAWMTIYIIAETSDRFGIQVEVPELKDAHDPEGRLWIAMWPQGENIFVSIAGAEQLKLPLETNDAEAYEGLKNKICAAFDNLKRQLVLEFNKEARTLSPVISVDQRLTYRHFKPILQNLAACGISQFSFEVLTPHETKVSHLRSEKEHGAQGI